MSNPTEAGGGPAGAAPELIRLQGVSKIYTKSKEPVTALNDIALVVRRREFVSIMGPSGSGKSTLLSIMGLLDRPTSGVYTLEGVDLNSLKDRELARIRRDHFGFIFQQYNLFPELTAVENVEVPMIYAGVPARERRRRAVELLEQVGLGHRLKHRPSEMSGGEQQRTAIAAGARQLAHGPLCRRADRQSPDGSRPPGDAGAERAEPHGMTVLVVTHDPGLLFGAIAS